MGDEGCKRKTPIKVRQTVYLCVLSMVRRDPKRWQVDRTWTKEQDPFTDKWSTEICVFKGGRDKRRMNSHGVWVRSPITSPYTYYSLSRP